MLEGTSVHTQCSEGQWWRGQKGAGRIFFTPHQFNYEQALTATIDEALAMNSQEKKCLHNPTLPECTAHKRHEILGFLHIIRLWKLLFFKVWLWQRKRKMLVWVFVYGFQCVLNSLTLFCHLTFPPRPWNKQNRDWGGEGEGVLSCSSQGRSKRSRRRKKNNGGGMMRKKAVKNWTFV